jgi:hypothetical protein
VGVPFDRGPGLVALVLGLLAATALPRASDGQRAAETESRRDAGADSLDILEEVVSRGVAEDDATEIASELRATHLSREGSGARGKRWYVRTEAMGGYRVVYRAEGGWRDSGQSIRIGARRDRDRHGGFLEIVGVGPVAQLVVGGFRPRFGGGLLIGVRRSPFTSPRSPGSTAGGATAPTASIWGRKFGAALSLRAGAQEASVVVWRDSGEGEGCWTWLSRRTAEGVFAVALGTRRQPGARRADGVDASLFLARKFSAVVTAGEVARFRGRVFAIVRFSVPADGAWSLELFGAPAPLSASGGTAGTGDEFRLCRGGALHRKGKVRGVDTRLSFYANELRTSSSLLRRRRAEASVRGRTGTHGWWSASVRLSDEGECEYARDPVDYSPQWSGQKKLYVRAGWTGTGPGRLRQRYRLAARSEGNGSTGVVGTLGLTLVIRCLEAGVQVSNYSIAFGQTGYIVRPGVFGPESVLSVTRTGSDASARVCARWRGARLAFYWTQPWLKPPRSYLSLRLSF